MANYIDGLMNHLMNPNPDAHVPDDLKCPITMGYLEDPISLPCCGRAISRQPLIEYKIVKCPMCNADISNLNFNTIPKSVNISYLIEQHKAGKLKIGDDKSDDGVDSVPEDTEFVSTIKYIVVNGKVIGQLEISKNGDDYKKNFKTLLLVVVDKSGSMGGAYGYKNLGAYFANISKEEQDEYCKVHTNCCGIWDGKPYRWA